MKKTIREATPEDCDFILKMISDLADYEKAKDQVAITADQLKKDGFSDRPLYKVLVTEINDKPVGMALYYNRYSTWKGKSLYLEDFYIMPEHRGCGLGTMMMKKLAQIAVNTDCYRFEWQCLDWNGPSLNFYKSIGAELDPEWVNCRVEGAAITKLSVNHL